jgi:hypothetical protein
MTKSLIAIVFLCFFHLAVSAEPIRLSTSNLDYQITNTFSDVDLFTIDIDLDIPFQPGLYDNPTILNVNYRVFGSLEPGTPSGFPQFDLQRSISGAEFYQQGGSLMFEIAANADFSDGIQADELVDNGTILTLNAREVGNGRFHPPIFELYSDGTGRIQNSNNVHTVDPLLEVNFGDEYITDLEFSTDSTVLLDVFLIDEIIEDNGGGGADWLVLALMSLILISRKIASLR